MPIQIPETPEGCKIGRGLFFTADCFEAMATIPDGSVDMVLCDLPYGTTANKWDSVLPLGRLWAEYRRLARPNSAIALTAAQPFTSMLVTSAADLFKQELIWCKNIASNFMQANRMHMPKHESVLVFGIGKPPFNPQLSPGTPYVQRRNGRDDRGANYVKNESDVFTRTDTVNTGVRKPTSLLNFSCERGLHPTQKPAALFEYLIRTYSNEGGVILDNTAGSGTTAIAAENCSRQWICIERDPEYAAKAMGRIESHLAPSTPLQPALDWTLSR